MLCPFYVQRSVLLFLASVKEKRLLYSRLLNNVYRVRYIYFYQIGKCSQSKPSWKVLYKYSVGVNDVNVNLLYKHTILCILILRILKK